MQIGLILVSLAFPLLELAVLIKVGQAIGFWWTVLLLVLTAVVGGLIIHNQGLSAARRTMVAMQEGRPPVEPVVDSVMLMLAGMLLLIPGLITDAAGLALLVPPLRRGLARWALRRMMAAGEVRVETAEWRSPGGHGQGAQQRQPGPGPVIEGEWERVDETKPKANPDPAPPLGNDDKQR